MAADTRQTRRGIILSVGCLGLGLLLHALTGCTPPSTAPVAVITASATSGEAPLEIQFNGSQSYVSGRQDLANYHWEFGDAASADGCTVGHTYLTPGTYTVELSLTDDSGRSSASRLGVTAVQLLSDTTDWAGTSTFSGGDAAFVVSVTNEQGAPVSGVECRVATDNSDAVVLAVDPGGGYAPTLGVIGDTTGIEDSALSPRYAVEKLRDLILHTWDSTFYESAQLSDEHLPKGLTQELIARDYEFWRGPLTLDYLANEGSELLMTLGFAGSGFVDEVIVFGLLLVPVAGEALGPAYQVVVVTSALEDAATEILIQQQVAAYKAQGYRGEQQFDMFKARSFSSADPSVLIVAREGPGVGGGLPSSSTLVQPAAIVLPASEAGKEQSVQFSYRVNRLGAEKYFTAIISPGGNTYSQVVLASGTYQGVLRYEAPGTGKSTRFSIQGQMTSSAGGSSNDDSETVTFQVTVQPDQGGPDCSEGTPYNRTAAIEYAARWWSGFNTPPSGPYRNYTNDGGDCANFASQCLIAGGVDLARKGTANGQGKTITSSTLLAQYLKTCVSGVTSVSRTRAEGDPSWFAPGDVAIFDANGTPEDAVGTGEARVKHTVFAVGRNGAGAVTCAAHSDPAEAVTVQAFLAANSQWNYCTYYDIPDCLTYNSGPAPTPALLAAPQLQAPADGASSQPLVLTLQWASVEGANKYWVLVAKQSNMLPTDPNASDCTECIYKEYTQAQQLTVNLEAGTTYFWRVQGFNDSVSPIRQGNYSTTRSFSTTGGPCAYSLSSYEQPFTSAGGSAGFTVYTSAGCTWSATADSAWIVLTKANGTGEGPVNYTVQAYSGSTARTGRITVQGQTLIVSQAGTSPCTYSLSTYSQTYTDSGAHSASFSVSTGTGCAWTAVVDPADTSWLSATASTPTGSGTVSYSVGANNTTAPRTGEIRVQDKTFTVTQAGKPAPVIELDHVVVSGPSIVNENSVGAFTCTAYLNDGTSFDVTSAATWTEDSPSASISLGNLTVGSLSGDSSCAVRASYTYNGINKWAFKAVALKDIVTVLDRIEVTGPTVVNENSSGSFACTAHFSDGSSAIVTGAAGWTCAPSSSWGTHPSTVTITGGRLSVGALDGDDDWAVTASYTYGTSTKYRGVAVHLHDTTPPPPPPDPCTFEVGPTTASRVAAQGGSGVICVRTSAGCQWQAVASDSWIHVTTGSTYTGNGDVGYTVDMNPGPERSGTIVAAGRTCTIPQSSSAPPVARLTMSAQGRTAYENGTLNLTIASGQTVTVQLSAARSSVDTGVPSAQWFIDNFLGPGGSETSWDFSTAGSHPVRLDVMNSDGTTASASAQIMITIGP